MSAVGTFLKSSWVSFMKEPKSTQCGRSGAIQASESKKILGAPFKAIQIPVIKGSLNTSKGLIHSAGIYPVPIS